MTPPTAMATTPADASRWIFRANASWEVVPYDRLRPNDQASLAAFARDPEFFGVLRPRQVADGTIKAISRSVALLIYALETPGIIPRVAVASGDASILDAAWRLTLDGVLEVARGDEFVSGAHALTTSSTGIPDGVIARLSMDALQFVARIGQADAATMSERLYHYNRRPFTPRWGARIRSASDVLAFASAGPGTPASAALEQHWRHKTMERRDPWLSWWPRTAARRTRRAGHADVTYKLYVNPQTEALPTAFPAFVDVLREAGAPPFKIGASASGILRPDKLVVYFTERDAAEDVGAALLARLAGMAVQALPFTRELGGDGLVSLGVDPPSGRAMLMQVGVSWRQWICRRLASYVSVGLRSGRADADRFAIERVALDGIDPSTWEPSVAALRGFASGANG